MKTFTIDQVRANIVLIEELSRDTDVLNICDMILKHGIAQAHPDLLRSHRELLEAVLSLLPLTTPAMCLQSVKWTTARDKALTAIRNAEALTAKEAK